MDVYAIARREFVNSCKRAREIISTERSGRAIHQAEIDLRYARDNLVWIRKNRP